MPPRSATGRNTRRNNRLPGNNGSNETSSDPNMVTAINEAITNLLPNLVTQTVEAVLNQIRPETRTNNGASETAANGTDNHNNGIHLWNSRFQKQRPKSFSHANTPIDAKNWIAHIEMIFEIIGMPGEYKVKLATSKLEDDAQTWWDEFKEVKGGASYVTTLSWVEFRGIFFGKYFSTAERDAYIREYAVIRQKDNESGSDFITRFTRLASVVGEAAGSAEIQAEKCKWAVSEGIRKSIMYMKFKDLTEVAEAIKTCEFDKKEYLSRVGDSKKRNREGLPSQTSSQSGDDDKKSSKLQCKTCGKYHHGECYLLTGNCFRCGQTGHTVRNCPKPSGDIISKEGKLLLRQLLYHQQLAEGSSH